MAQPIELLRTSYVTHDVMRLVTTRPEGFEFEAGQAVKLSIDDPQWQDKGRPFTPTSRADDRVLEFEIKRYDAHAGVTAQLATLVPGARLNLSGPFGALTYKGPGVYIAGGAGITPFLAQLRTLAARGELPGHTLLFSNRHRHDVIDEHELRGYLGERAVFTLTGEQVPGYEYGRIDRGFLERFVERYDQHFYLCGPSAFTKALSAALEELGAQTEQLVV